MDEKPKKKITTREQLEHMAEHFIKGANNAKMQTFNKLNFHHHETENDENEDEIILTFTQEGLFYRIDKDGNLLDDEPFAKF